MLEVEASDDKSICTYFYTVGRSPGSDDVVTQTEFNGPAEMITNVRNYFLEISSLFKHSTNIVEIGPLLLSLRLQSQSDFSVIS